MTIIRWFFSKTVREAVAMKRHVSKLLQHQRDILKPDSVKSVEAIMANVSTALRTGADKAALKQELKRLEETANTCLKPYPSPAWRENVEVLLVALAVAMGIRTFFLQPFKIPTGSMQPTLYGVTSENLIGRKDVQVPTGWARVQAWFAGDSYVHFVADSEGEVNRILPPVGIGRHGSIFKLYQKFSFAGKTHTIWLPPDMGGADLATRAGIERNHHYKRGEDVINMRVRSGDHLFVDRLTYNFRAPKRGEIIVFETKGIYAWDALGQNRMPQDQFYIKRLVGLGGERIQIGNDRHLRINGTNRLDASTPHFEFVYGFNPGDKPRDSHFSGHVNEAIAQGLGFSGIAPKFRDEPACFEIRSGQLMVMGDNTMNSFDSRGWGTFPATNVIGRSCFVYWPLSSRFGWANIRH
jgi:signal peptidase I